MIYKYSQGNERHKQEENMIYKYSKGNERHKQEINETIT
jgi:hypothetical protein